MTVPEIPIKNIKGRDERFRKDSGDIKALADSIQEVGLLHPIVIDEDNKLVAGERRIEAFELLEYDVIPFTRISIDDSRVGELHENKERKDFTITEVVEIKKYIASTRKKEAGKLPGSLQKGDSREVTSKVTGISARQIDKMETIVEKAKTNTKVKKLLDKIESSGRGEGPSVNTVHKIATKEDRNLPKVPLPTEEHDIFVVDVPIKWKDEGARGAADNHYPTMTKEELMAEKIPSAKNSMILFWIPTQFIIDGVEIETEWRRSTALEILHAWDFVPVGEYVWKKDKFGVGSRIRNQHETLIMAVKGTMPEPMVVYPSIIEASRGKHSEKPEIVFEMAKKMYPGRKYCELYGRQEREGWTVHGNQVKPLNPLQKDALETIEEIIKNPIDVKTVKDIVSKTESPIEKLRRLKK